MLYKATVVQPFTEYVAMLGVDPRTMCCSLVISDLH